MAFKATEDTSFPLFFEIYVISAENGSSHLRFNSGFVKPTFALETNKKLEHEYVYIWAPVQQFNLYWNWN